MYLEMSSLAKLRYLEQIIVFFNNCVLVLGPLLYLVGTTSLTVTFALILWYSIVNCLLSITNIMIEAFLKERFQEKNKVKLRVKDERETYEVNI